MSRKETLKRAFVNVNVRAEDDSGELWVEGYACKTDIPTVLFTIRETEYKEVIKAGAFDSAKMEDVIFNYNHSGKVLARTRNKTLDLVIDDVGLLMKARLDGTEEGRKIYEEIKGGYIDRMSFAFTVEEESYNSEEHLWSVYKIKRLYDVSAVDFPAYDDTSIEARRNSILEADAQELRQRNAAAELQKRKLSLKTRL